MQKTFLRETAGVVMRATVVIVTIVVVISSISALYEVETGISDGTCNVAVFPIEGVILPFYGLMEYDMVTTPEMVESFMQSVEDDDNIQAVLVEINSPGGTPVASERIAERFRNSSLPIIGLAGDLAASGGYMVAAATDYLIASPMSDIGSIGVNMSYVEESKKNEDEGLTYVQLTTGKFKDIGDPNRAITEEEKQLLLADLNIVHNEFVDMIAKYREIDRDKVAALADGSSMPGKRALENNLIDALGGREEARGFLATVLETDASSVHFCEYQRSLLPF
ncbi:MAG: signal peptide peptidase SppA [Candidatus Pacebacteria bacterium]|nr:signal peptide peptidase SppA [Candidatus Paceibacterota bacterium]